MSDLMLHGKLNMPLPDEPQDCDVVTWVQFKAAAKEAADRIEELEAKLTKVVEALRGWIEFANEEGMPVALSDLEAAELTGGKDE